MKVDLENKAELRRKRAELQKWIAVIDLALGDTPTNGGSVNGAHPSVPELLVAVLDKLNDEFNASEAYSLVDESKRPALKLALKQAAKDDILTITQQGKGRRSTVYRRN
jgi:hypothetical protein